ncbi:MAG TPA: hypothetical protein VK045_04105 [Ornithinicoccus sp.]|nr:hypothetical protein [Ornithinicoccus sp.]
MTAPESWTQDPEMRRAITEAITVITGRCEPYDPDALIGTLVKYGYCVIPAPEPLGPPGSGVGR